MGGIYKQMRAAMAMKVAITSRQREKLIEFFGEKGANIVISHIDDLEETFGSASVVIRRVMEESKVS
jgi:ferritin